MNPLIRVFPCRIKKTECTVEVPPPENDSDCKAL